MTLEAWTKAVKPQLEAIGWFAYRIKGAVEALPVRPAFLSNAECDLDAAEIALEAALKSVRESRAAYAAKPMELSHVA